MVDDVVADAPGDFLVEQSLANLGDVPSAAVSEWVAPIPITEVAYEGRPNQHAWMRLDSAVVYVDNIRDALVAHDLMTGTEFPQWRATRMRFRLVRKPRKSPA